MFYFALLAMFIFGLCWGSFLNVVAHRLARGASLFTMRSKCPSCYQVIAWYDNIPVFSYLVLRGRCRLCKEDISVLYPFIELLTGSLFVGLFVHAVRIQNTFIGLLTHFGGFIDSNVAGDLVRFYHVLGHQFYSSFLIYILFFSALVVAIRTDLEAMVIPQCVSIWLVPFAVFFSWSGFMDISWRESMLGALLGYGILWFVAFIFKNMAHKDGMGVGDMELLAMIGAFLGPIGAWAALFIGSIIGFIGGITYLLVAHKHRSTRIPFGPFLAIGAISYFFLKDLITALLFC